MARPRSPPSRPGEFHPEPLTDSGRESLDSSGSCHPTKAAAFCHRKEFLRLPVDSIATWVTCPLRSVGITPLHHYYETVRPCPADQYFRPRGASACAFSLNTAGRFSSSVPEPRIESRHLCTGHHMASKQISAMLVPRAEGTLRFRCRLWIRFDAFSVVHLRSSLYSSHDVIYSRLLTTTFTTAAFDRSSSWLFEACFCKPASKGLPSSPAQLALGHLRVKIPQLRLALEGKIRPHHRFMLRRLLDQDSLWNTKLHCSTNAWRTSADKDRPWRKRLLAGTRYRGSIEWQHGHF